MSEEQAQVSTDGGVSASTGEPFVTISMPQTKGQWTCDEARAFALVLIRTADAAEADADILAALLESGQHISDLDPAVGAFVQAVRAERAKR